VKFFRSIKSIFGSPSLTPEILDELEEQFLLADVGTTTTQKLILRLKEIKGASADKALQTIKEEMVVALTIATNPNPPSPIHPSPSLSVFYFVGVNGSGKTTTIAKFAHSLSAQRKTQDAQRILLVAADTFRAAAIDQLKVWADRVGADFVSGQPGADPSSVIVDGLRKAKSVHADIVLIDTAGRLQTKHNLIQELQKMVRMTEKELGKKPDEIFLVIDAVTGQNGLSQAKIFCEAIPVTGIILTKCDSTAKGGIIFAIVEETKLPIRCIGFGEGLGNLKAFDAKEFVEGLFV
jgi:fused signal recognition particle receptor